MTEPPSGSLRGRSEPPPTAPLRVLAVSGGAHPLLLGLRPLSGRPSRGTARPLAVVHDPAPPVLRRRIGLPGPGPERPGPPCADRADLAAPGMNGPRATGIDL
ncbi:hypothetical protein GCM10023086_26470 [Streptomyces venetus]|uniref:Transferase n=1 Tax=Streptomyces venetus TaxID=1701086 RepID=A0ABP8FNM7_9ACTN